MSVLELQKHEIQICLSQAPEDTPKVDVGEAALPTELLNEIAGSRAVGAAADMLAPLPIDTREAVLRIMLWVGETCYRIGCMDRRPDR